MRRVAYTLLAGLAATAAFATDASARHWRRGYHGPRVARPWVAPRYRYARRPWVRRAAWRGGYARRRPYYGWGYGYSYPSYYGYAARSYGGAVYVGSGLRAYAYPTYVLSTVTYASSGAGCGYWAYGCGWNYSYPAYALPTYRRAYANPSYGYANVGYGFGTVGYGAAGYGCGTCPVSYSWRPCGCW